LNWEIDNIKRGADKYISDIFHEELNSKEFQAPKIDNIHVDTPYESRQFGNAIVTKFEDVDKIAGKEIEMDYECPNELYELHQDFTDERVLISTCKKIEKKKE